MVGVGSGGIAADKTAFGIDLTPEDAGKLTREGTELLLKCWGGEPFTFTGDYFQFDVPSAQEAIKCGVLMRPFQQPHPPIALAGVNRNSYGLGQAGERGWLPLSTNFLPPNALASHWDSYAQGAARAKRTPDRTLWRVARDVHVADTTEQARRDVREGAHGRAYSEYLLPLVTTGGRGLGAFKTTPELPDDAVTIDYLIDNVWIVGSPDEVARKLRAVHAESGGFGTVLQIAHDWAPNQAIFHRSMELLAKRVFPQLADL
jgi:alkanesulfonate monooxygenase SsuD/methylene tetrahydromethanopterin reductase-like flavin-dependent oxidoreductase (luciferase family)